MKNKTTVPPSRAATKEQAERQRLIAEISRSIDAGMWNTRRGELQRQELQRLTTDELRAALAGVLIRRKRGPRALTGRTRL